MGLGSRVTDSHNNDSHSIEKHDTLKKNLEMLGHMLQRLETDPLKTRSSDDQGSPYLGFFGF